MKKRIENSPRSVPRNRRLSNRTIRIFLAEDSPLLMVLLARIVSKDERILIVGSAPDGLKALGNAATLTPDLVITDLHMPGLDGAEFTRRVKQWPHPPLVFVATSDETPEARARCLAAGADVFLVKGMDLVSQLLATIHEFFPDHLEPSDTEPTHLCETLTTAE